MKIKAVYLIGSQSDSVYGNIVKIATSGNITHVALIFYVGRKHQPIPPVETSIENQSQWIINNSVNTNGTLKIHIDRFNENLVLDQGFYVFETNSDITNHINAPQVIKATNQMSGCVITPLETYRISHPKNVIIKLDNRPHVLTDLIKQYWGEPYGLDSILNNLNSNLSMVCTQLCIRYINTVYTKNYDMFSPTKLVFEVGNMLGESSYKEDDFLDKKFLLYHYLWSSLPLILIFLTVFLIFMYVVNHKIILSDYNFKNSPDKKPSMSKTEST